MEEKKNITLPGWEIVKVLGHGSFGTVYEIKKAGQFGSVTHSAQKVISIPLPRRSWTTT